MVHSRFHCIWKLPLLAYCALLTDIDDTTTSYRVIITWKRNALVGGRDSEEKMSLKFTGSLVDVIVLKMFGG